MDITFKHHFTSNILSKAPTSPANPNEKLPKTKFSDGSSNLISYKKVNHQTVDPLLNIDLSMLTMKDPNMPNQRGFFEWGSQLNQAIEGLKNFYQNIINQLDNHNLSGIAPNVKEVEKNIFPLVTSINKNLESNNSTSDSNKRNWDEIVDSYIQYENKDATKLVKTNPSPEKEINIADIIPSVKTLSVKKEYFPNLNKSINIKKELIKKEPTKKENTGIKQEHTKKENTNNKIFPIKTEASTGNNNLPYCVNSKELSQIFLNRVEGYRRYNIEKIPENILNLLIKAYENVFTLEHVNENSKSLKQTRPKQIKTLVKLRNSNINTDICSLSANLMIVMTIEVYLANCSNKSNFKSASNPSLWNSLVFDPGYFSAEGVNHEGHSFIFNIRAQMKALLKKHNLIIVPPKGDHAKFLNSYFRMASGEIYDNIQEMLKSHEIIEEKRDIINGASQKIENKEDRKLLKELYEQFKWESNRKKGYYRELINAFNEKAKKYILSPKGLAKILEDLLFYLKNS